ncbi:efflux RND transporter periplasmic adaptor subunit [Lignipirellula cremea]|uniref:Efflux pump periplasmic linker BepF n=1 Tax=Lignipirellula cremea TaxID=2528010 RepID=A0A518E4K0_9BACT|nr:efflux RND transporter periplasmic adaptor subunit [Lignipirellula cremea]QDU98993.1 Efflux pump periplasmic linker BepF [Lignipirellula cremea]
MKYSAIAAILLALVSLSLSGCVPQAEWSEKAHAESQGEEGHGASEGHGEADGHGHHRHKILVTSPLRKDVISTQQYVCQIHSCQHIEVRALEGGYLDEIRVNEGQAVKKGELMFKIRPILYQAKLDTEVAEAQRIQIELDNAVTLNKKGIVSPQEIALKKAELAKAQAKVELARAELAFASVTAPFDGIVDRQRNQVGSLIEEGDVLTTFSDNSLMWVYFNVREARYLEYKEELDKGGDTHDQMQIELKLANGQIFPQPGKIGAIEADFNNLTGNIPFRADFPNPKGLLRNGQTGTILIHRQMKNALVIPQRATYEILARRYAFVVDEENVVHQRDITIQSEQDDIFVIEDGLKEGEKIVLEGIRQVRDGDKIEYEFVAPEEALSDLKYHAE